MILREVLDGVIQFVNFCAVYYVIQLVRCAMISIAVFAIVFLLRKTLAKDRVFLKGLLWSLFIPVLFAGKMKFFYENPVGTVLFSWWTGIFMNHVWLGWLYLCGVLVCAARIFRRRSKLKKLIAGMEKIKVENTFVYVAKMPVTPSAAGVFRPKIVMPEVMLKEYEAEELRTILLHEKIHIRSGHLLCYFLWDVFCALLWINPLLTLGMKFFREDLEEICDMATIRQSGIKAYDYGRLLLKSMKILQAESRDFNMYAAFAQDREYGNVRLRMLNIAKYKPYKIIGAACVPAAAMLCAAAALACLQYASYGRYNENDIIFTYGYDGREVVFFDNSDILHQIISYDERYVYVNKDAFEKHLGPNNADVDIFIVFGGFYKLPGVGGVGCSCLYEPDADSGIVKISYKSPMDDWRIKLLKVL